MHALWGTRSSKIQSLRAARTQLAFLGEVFFRLEKANFAASGICGYSSLKVFESYPNPPDNEEKQAATFPASLSPSLLDLKKLKAISRVGEIGPTGELRPQVLYLIELGMDLDQIKDIARRFPPFAFLSLEGKIKPLVEFLLDLGVSKSDIPTIFSRFPQLCGCSLSENLIPSMAFFESLGVDKNQWAKMVYRFPSLLCYSRQKIKTTVDFLYEIGLSAESIGEVLTRFPQIIGHRVKEKLRPTADYFQSLGVNFAVLVHRRPNIFSLSIESNLKPVTQFFLDRGYSMEEVGTMISRYGTLYSCSLEESLIPKWEFFLTMDYPQSDLVKIPAYFGCSLEKRIKPRYALMKECGVVVALSSLVTLSSGGFDKALKSKMKGKLAKPGAKRYSSRSHSDQ